MIDPRLVEDIDQWLPQTQCTRCGYPSCRAYAEAVAKGEIAINRCPPGGSSLIKRLAARLGVAVLGLDSSCGPEPVLAAAVIDEAWCIGCTICIQICPVDAIVGAAGLMHTVVVSECTGCELCVQPCPTDCIEMLPIAMHPQRDELDPTWTPARARLAKSRFQHRQGRLLRVKQEREDRQRRTSLRQLSREDKKRAIEQAVVRVTGNRKQVTDGR